MATSWEVELSEQEWAQACDLGLKRREDSKDRGYKNKFNLKLPPQERARQELKNDEIGAAGEKAFSVLLSHRPFLPTLNNLHGPDVAPNFQVRTSRSAKLKVQSTDPDDQIVVGMQYLGGRSFRYLGWIKAADGKLPQWWSDPGSYGHYAYFIPERFLNKALPKPPQSVKPLESRRLERFESA